MTTGKWIGNQLKSWSFNLMSYDAQGLNSGLIWNPNIFVRQILLYIIQKKSHYLTKFKGQILIWL